jgi:hypothetical protein
MISFRFFFSTAPSGRDMIPVGSISSFELGSGYGAPITRVQDRAPLWKDNASWIFDESSESEEFLKKVHISPIVLVFF